MKDDRYVELDTTKDAKLTQKELDAGWHFCCDWDGLLIHKNWPEADCCTCGERKANDNT